MSIRREIPDGPVLVTGASGFLGAHLVRSLVSDGADVHALIRSGARLDRLGAQAGVTVWRGDITDAEAVKSCLGEMRPSTIFHLAAHTAARRAPADREQALQALQVNLLGVINMLHGAEASGAPVQRFVRLGGLEEYGAGPSPSCEAQRERPRSPYSASQVAATHWCQMIQPSLAFPVVTLRPALTFGPGQSTDFLIPALIDALLEGRRFATTAGNQSRDLVFVEDAIDALRAAAIADGLHGAIINVGSGLNFVIRDVVAMVADILDAHALLDIGGAAEREGDLACLAGDPAEAERLLGWRVTTSLRDGLRLTIDWRRSSLSGVRDNT
ncbi:MAG: SDR family NAD(P)-dependent oxidoreductase [Alphaproteobacteria bacterium]|nr:SDR family NAD(P)-dependent oxidoreductase [Alphaproteobacteria bacterium]